MSKLGNAGSHWKLDLAFVFALAATIFSTISEAAPARATSFDELNSKAKRQVQEMSQGAFWYLGDLYISGTIVDRERFLKSMDRRYDGDMWSFSTRESDPYALAGAPVIVRLKDKAGFRDREEVVRAAVAAAIQEAEPTAEVFSVEVTQVLGTGVLGYRNAFRSRRLGEEPIRIEMSDVSTYVDGSTFFVAAKRRGTYRYTAVSGGVKTIEKWVQVSVDVPGESEMLDAGPEQVFQYLLHGNITMIPRFAPEMNIVSGPTYNDKTAGGRFTRRSVGKKLASKGKLEVGWTERSFKIRLLAKRSPKERKVGTPVQIPPQ